MFYVDLVVMKAAKVAELRFKLSIVAAQTMGDEPSTDDIKSFVEAYQAIGA